MKTVFSLLLALLCVPFGLFAQHVNLLIGSYTNTGKSEGIYVYDFNTETGEATRRSVAKATSPSFLALSADRKHVYAVTQTADREGAVNAYAFDDETGQLTFLNQEVVGSRGPCHIAIDREGRFVIVANYSGGAVSVLPVEEDGSVGPLAQLIEHEGSGPNADRQQEPHVHSAFFSADEKQVYVQDLGTDKVNIYDFHPESKTSPLVPSAQPFVMGTPGGGPRHAAVAKDGRFVYVVEEMLANVKVYANTAGKLEPIQTISVNEEGYEGADGAADIKFSPDGKFLYASNRGDANTLAIYKVDAADGTLTKVGNQPTLGKRPRNFTVSPDGKYVLVGHQETEDVVIFARDPETGLLTDTGNRIDVGAPVCLVF